MLRGRLSVLLVTAIPEGVTPFRAGRKTTSLRRRLSPLIEHGQLTLAVEAATRAGELRRLIEIHRPDVLHVVCHTVGTADGGGLALALENQHGGRAELDAKELAVLLDHPPRLVKLVILEACQSSSIARDLFAAHEDLVVIGTREDIVPKASTRFFLSFHESLASAKSIAESFSEAQRDMELFAPSIWGIPVMYGQEAQSSKSLTTCPSVVSFNVDPNRREDFVRIPRALQLGVDVVGREDVLRTLDEHWFGPEDAADTSARPHIIHLKGKAGIGKSAIVARWLALHESRSWCGATRVFAWSFDPLSTGPATGDAAAFFREAFDFFGGVSPMIKEGAGEASPDGEWLAGLRLARLLRNERVLLCLDDVPCLPRGSEDSRTPHAVFEPGIAALLHELSRGHAGMCLITTRLSVSVELEPLGEISVGGLDVDAATELLLTRGVIEPAPALTALAKEFCSSPLALSLVGVALAAGHRPDTIAGRSSACPNNPLALLGTDEDEDARRLLTYLRLSGGTLDANEVAMVAEPLASATWRPQWENLPKAMLDALRMLRRRGVVEVRRDRSVALTHAAMLQHIDGTVGPNPRFLEYSRRALGRNSNAAVNVRQLARTIRVALGLGQLEVAVQTYKDNVCRIGTGSSTKSYLSRSSGIVAGTLTVLAEFFEVTPGGCMGLGFGPHTEIKPDDQGLLLHHAGRALRHLGQMSAATERFTSALAAYKGNEERSAICANDLAEALMWTGKFAEALHWADRAVRHAAQAVTQTEDDKDARRTLTALFVCLATRGYVYMRQGGLHAASVDFASANAVVVLRHKKNSPENQYLFARPGFYYWAFLLDEIERCKTNAEAQPTLELLADLVHRARLWHRSKKFVARVSRAFDALMQGKTMILCFERGLPCPDCLLPQDDQPQREHALAKEAFVSLSYAINVFRSTQHLWMLPDALITRARVHDALADPTNAERDRAEARVLESIWSGV